MSQFDAMIAAIARSHGATLATRNTDDFENCGIRLVNPWTARDVH
jgi:toxin FitB